MLLPDFVIIGRQWVRRFGFWYKHTSSGKRNVFLGVVGGTLGWQYGKFHFERRKAAGEFADFLMITRFNVDKAEEKPFETNWNALSRVTQKSNGYEWTRLFKTFDKDWTSSPCNYLQVQLWKNKELYTSFINGELAQAMVHRLEENAQLVSEEFISVVDDSVERMIK